MPEEMDYLQKNDQMKTFNINYINMSDRFVDLLIRFLEQNQGTLSKREKIKEFELLMEEEIAAIEKKYSEIFRMS